MSTTTAASAEIDRGTAETGAGTRTADRENRSRMNADNNGMTASLLVLPGENAQVFQARVDGWVDTLRPRNDVERFLAEQAARTSWQLERVQRRGGGPANWSILEATNPTVSPAEMDEVVVLGRRLFWDRGGPIELYPNMLFSQSHSTRTSWSGIVDDPDDPARLVIRLSQRSAGANG